MYCFFTVNRPLCSVKMTFIYIEKPKILCNTLYCAICFIAVVWN